MHLESSRFELAGRRAAAASYRACNGRAASTGLESYEDSIGASRPSFPRVKAAASVTTKSAGMSQACG